MARRLLKCAADKKFCPTCRQCLPKTAFGYLTARTGGLRPHCRQCVVRYNARYRLEYRHRRRARMNNAKGTFTLIEFDKLKAKYGYHCLSCGKSTIHLTADHIVPISRGGSNSIDNIQPLCRECNSHKGVKTIDYRTGSPFLVRVQEASDTGQTLSGKDRTTSAI